MNIRTEDRMDELLQTAAWLAEKYTGGMSTSIPVEKAQELMDAILYCIREYEEEQESGFALTNARCMTVKEIYEKGYELVVRKVKKMRAFYNHLSRNFQSYGCRNCADVMEKGMPEFFRRYDPRYGPQNTILTLDYPILLPVKELTGIDAVEQYLSGLSLEQKFLGAFDGAYVRRTLQAFDWNYREQFFNLCGIFLQNVLGCILMGKPPDIPAGEAHLEQIRKRQAECTGEEIEKELDRILKKLVAEHYQGNELLYEYLCEALPDLAFRIKKVGAAVFSWM